MLDCVIRRSGWTFKRHEKDNNGNWWKINFADIRNHTTLSCLLFHCPPFYIDRNSDSSNWTTQKNHTGQTRKKRKEHNLIYCAMTWMSKKQIRFLPFLQLANIFYVFLLWTFARNIISTSSRMVDEQWNLINLDKSSRSSHAHSLWLLIFGAVTSK